MTADQGVEIPLSKGLVAVVDAEDAAWARQFKWHAHNSRGLIYARRTQHIAGNGKNGTKLRLRMHREIMNPADDMVVDHINGNTLDNRRSNLRTVTRSENMRNVEGAQSCSATGIRGIEYDKGRDRWRATIRVDGKRIRAGCFKTKEEAAALRLELEQKHHGIQPRRAAAFAEIAA